MAFIDKNVSLEKLPSNHWSPQIVINGTYKATISGNTGISTVKLTITGSKYGPMKSNFTMSFDKNTNKPKYIYSGTLSIGNQTFDINEIIDLI